jgi:hypothetical protein
VAEEGVQPLRPAGAVLAEREPQPGQVAQPLDLLGRDPRGGQHLLGEQHREPARVEPIRLRASTFSLERDRLAGVGQLDDEPAVLQLADDPAPAAGRLDRDPRSVCPATASPSAQPLARGGEPLLDDLARGGVEDRRLKHVLVDVDRAVQRLHQGPPLELTGRDRTAAIGGPFMTP